jgi:hypothetical protein
MPFLRTPTPAKGKAAVGFDGERTMEEGKNGKRSEPRFPLGQTVMTKGIAAQIPEAEVYEALRRHQCGDWGQVCQDDWNENEHAVKEGFRLLSVYTSREGVKFWIITEWDRSVTTVLLPDEY